MKIKILMLMMIIAGISFAEERDINKIAKYRVPQSSEYIVAIEQGAYDDFLKMVDEENRQKGIVSNYSNKATKKAQRLHDDVDLVPIAHYTDNSDSYITELTSLKEAPRDSDVWNNYHVVSKLANGKIDISDEELGKMSYKRSGYQNRFYFGNGNTLKDIIYKDKDGFSNQLIEIKKENKDKYLIEGLYKTIGSRNDLAGASEDEKRTNLLGITMDEYYSEIEGKSREQVAAFLKTKMEQKGILNIIQKKDELYTTDNKGKEWKVLWKLEPVSLFRTVEENFKDTVFTQIYTYTPFEENSATDIRGRLLYTKDNSIYLEDKLPYKDSNVSLKIGNGWSSSTKNLNDIITEAKRKAEVGEAPSSDNAIEQYYSDKKKLSEKDFNDKWVKPFEDGTFDAKLNGMKKEIIETKKKLAIVEKEYNDAKVKEETAKADPDFPSDLSTWSWKYKSEAEKEIYLATKTAKQKELIKEWYKNYEIRDKKGDEKLDLEIDVQQGIPKKYGFYNSSWGPATDREWLDRVTSYSNIIRDLLGKNVEFRGRGRIDGTIDLGEGSNQLTIKEQFTGRYGTNIILGPYAKLKNIDVVNVGGQIGSDSGVSISGRASLTLDIDPNIKNKEGNLVQHALKDSDKNIVFQSTYTVLNVENRNKFNIELMASKIGEEIAIDLGRKIDYKHYDVAKGEELDMTIPFISDSIAHQVVDNKRFSNAGTSLLDVKIKDEIKRLGKEENEVYKSIKAAKKIGVLGETLTTTNKRTTYNVKDDEREGKKLLDLAVYLKEKKGEDLIKDLAQFNLSETDQTKMLSLIEEIKNGKTVQDNIKKEERLKDDIKNLKELKNSEKYNAINLEKLYEDLNQFNLDELRAQREDATVRNENTPKIKAILNAVDMTAILELKDIYANFNLDNIATYLNSAKNRDVKPNDKWAYFDFSSLLGDINSLKEEIKKQLAINEEDLQKDLNTINKQLVEELEKYNGASSEMYRELKNKLYYTMREEEVLAELKTLLNQMSDRNIYSKLNKISKNEISTYTNIPFEISHALSKDRELARGGFISARTVQDKFKGNTYTGYGLYEKTADSGTKYGILFGGANTKHNEVYERTLDTVATESEVKGVSAYIGGYFNKPVIKNLNWISGVGAQYGSYKISREMKNNYQNLEAKGKSKIASLNTYTGFTADYPIHEDVYIQMKGILSYTMVNQGKVNESGDLPLNIDKDKYHYIDGELGLSFNKIFYDDNLKSSISAGAYAVAGLYGYKNDDLNARVAGGNSNFRIKGDRIKKDAVKILIDYNVQEDAGFNYGLEGTYISNSEENNVRIGVKAGYTF